MEDINKFLENINKDAHPSSQPPNTTRHVLNFVPLVKNGNMYSITNEDGTVLISEVTFPTGFKVMGYSTLNNDIIVVLASDSGFSQVGYIREDSTNLHAIYGYYHPVAPYDKNTGTVPENNSELGFTVNYPVDCRSRKLIDGHRILYFTDNNVPFGRVDLDNPPLVGEAAESVKLVFDQKIPTIGLSEIKEEVQGNIKPGVYMFVTRYVTENGGVTTTGIPSNPIPMVPSSRSEGVNKYKGGFHEDANINKNIVLNISDIDTKYRELQVIAMWYTGTGVFQASVVASLPITSESLQYTFTGPGNESFNLTREEIRQVPISYTKAKCIEQKDNTLFLSNLSGDLDADEILQEVANNIKVSYEIEEASYCNRQEVGSNKKIGFTKIDGPNIDGLQGVETLFTEDINSASVTTSDFELKRNGTPSKAVITITDYTLMVTDSTTITLQNATSTGDLTFTAEASPGTSSSLTFVAAVSNGQTAINLTNTINDHPDMANYVAFANGADVELTWIGTGTGNTNAITITGGGTSGSTSMAGGTTDVTYHTPSSATVSGSSINLLFSNIDFLTTSDELYIDEIESITGKLYSTGVNAAGSKNYITLQMPSSTSESDKGLLQSGFTDYINERFTFEKKTYRRGEVYSLGFFLLYKDGTYSHTYHIPGNDKGDVGATSSITGNIIVEGKNLSPVANNNTGNSTGLLGTYISTADYPLKQNFPGNLDGDDTTLNDFGGTTITRNSRKILHHVMPTVQQEPHFRKVPGTFSFQAGSTFVRLIGLKFEYTKQIPQNILDNVAEIVFVRERRNTESNKSIYAQGVVHKLVETADHYNNDGSVSGSDVGGVLTSYHLTEAPFFGKLEGMTKEEISDGSWDLTYIQLGMTYPSLDYTDTSELEEYSSGDNQRFVFPRNNRCIFHSPETDLETNFKFDAGYLTSGKLKPLVKLKGTYKKLNFKGYYYKGAPGEAWLRHWGYCDMFCDYNDYEVLDTSTIHSILAAQHTKPGVRRNTALLPDNGKPNSLNTRWSSGGLEIKLDTNLVDPGGEKFVWDDGFVNLYKNIPCYSNCHRQSDDIGGLFFGNYVLNNSTLNERYEWVTNGELASNLPYTNIRNYLYNIEIENARQYGELAQARFIPIARFKPFNSDGSFSTEYSGVYSGDTFITKFSFNTGNILTKYGMLSNGGAWQETLRIWKPSGLDLSTDPRRDYYHIDGAGPEGSGPNKPEGNDLRECSYFFVESDINTYYRHRPADETVQDYFPNNDDPADMLSKYFPYMGNIQAYNSLYSYENDIKEYFIKGSTQAIVTKFENRTIYSEQAKEDSVIDSYRLFPVNNYYDLPSNTGPIWNSFVENGTLYLHTPKSLWRTFAEPAATLSGGNISDIVLGTGPLFMRPSTEVLTTEGGYAGTISQFGGAHTQIGYIFPDLLQGKVFCLAYGDHGPFLKELSHEGLTSYFDKNLSLDIIRDPVTNKINSSNITTENSNQIDNPFNGIGYMGGFDYGLKRYFLVKHGITGYDFTISYSTLTQGWISFHSYSPNLIIPYDNRVFFIRNGSTADMWEMNIGDKGNFFGTVYNSELEIVVAQGGNKVFNNLIVESDSTNRSNNIKIRDDNFETVQVFTDCQNTGPITLIHGNTFTSSKADGETFVKYRNGEYRVAIARDAVLDNGGDIFNPNNIYVPQGGTVPVDFNYAYRERIKGEYAHFKFIYNNTLNREFVLKAIRTIFEPNFR